MLKGLYTAAMGMNVQSKRMDVISNDLANAGTTGYKKDVVTVSSFKDEYLKRLDDSQNFISNEGTIGKITYGAMVDEIYTNFQQGAIAATGDDTNIAIQGDGFFVVQTPNGTAYTRDGSFLVNGEGDLVTSEGYQVMGQDGPISFGEDFFTNGGKIVVQSNGTIYLGNEYVDTIDIASFEDKRTLTKLDDNLYTSNGNRSEFTGSLIQGYLEVSNVNTVDAMVDMINVARAYEANQKVIQTMDTVLGKVVNDLGRA